MLKKLLARFPVKKHWQLLLSAVAAALILSGAASAQSTAFTYQGRLTDSGSPANSSYDMEFKLFDTVDVDTGTQQGDTITSLTVQVTNGTFAVALDFGPAVFDGTPRYLEISLRPAGSLDPYTVLAPRQPIASAPYAVRSLRATAADGLSVNCVNCVTSNQITSVEGTQVTGVIPIESVPEGSGNYIQNAATLARQGKNGAQPAASFNIEGDGIVGGMISGSTVNAASQFTIAGEPVMSLGTGVDNLFVGPFAGQADPTGSANSFFGRSAGFNTSTGIANAFFGRSAGFQNTSGGNNSFFGVQAGRDNSTGFGNSFFGRAAGLNNTMGVTNAFFGASAGVANTTGHDNAFFGVNAGFSNVDGSRNTVIGNLANVGAGNLSNATAIGAGAIVTASDRIQIGRMFQDTVAIGDLTSGSSVPVCITAVFVFSNCSSSLRYKESIQPFTSGLSLLQRLRPVTFNWKGRVEADLGLIAEEVAEVEPLLITHNQKGEIEGVKYAQLNLVLINAVKEQQSQIQQQQQQIKQQQQQIDALKKLLCQQNPQADICR